MQNEITMVEIENNLRYIIKKQEEIVGLWNGKESGGEEDRSQRAIEIIDTAIQLLELLED